MFSQGPGLALDLLDELEDERREDQDGRVVGEEHPGHRAAGEDVREEPAAVSARRARDGSAKQVEEPCLLGDERDDHQADDRHDGEEEKLQIASVTRSSGTTPEGEAQEGAEDGGDRVLRRAAARFAAGRATGSPSGRESKKPRRLLLPEDLLRLSSEPNTRTTAAPAAHPHPGAKIQRGRRNSMRASKWRALWLPVVLCVVVADLNFWYWASTGESDLDYAGVLLFGVFAFVWLRRFLRSRDVGDGICGAGAVLALVLMVLREWGKWDRGYIPPYVVFILFVLLAWLIRRRPAAPVAVLLLGLVSVLPGPARADAPSGKVLFRDFCSSCHGADGKALTDKGKKLHARDLTDATWKAAVSDPQLVESVTNGHKKMRAFGRELTTREIRTLVKEIRALAAKPKEPK